MRAGNGIDDERLEALLEGNAQDERERKLAEILQQLREETPAAPEGLRRRIAEYEARTADAGPAVLGRLSGFLPTLSLRRAVLVAAPALLAVALGVAAVQGLVSASGDGSPSAIEEPAQPTSGERDEAAGGGGEGAGERRLAPVPQANEDSGTTVFRSATPPPAAEFSPVTPQADSAAGGTGPAAPVPSKTRAQEYAASLRLYFDDADDVSGAMQQAMRTTRALGGYVVYVDQSSSGEDGAGELQVRVPVRRVQTALVRFAELGTILDQHTELRDLQGQVDRQTRDIQRRRDRIAKLEAELKDPTLSESERDRLEAQLVQAKRGLARAERQRTALLRRASFASVSLAFTTDREEQSPPVPGRIERSLDDAAGVLAREVALGLYLLVVVSPFLALLLLAGTAARVHHRRAELSLLERL